MDKSCFQWFKDTNSKANHNSLVEYQVPLPVVFNGSKILIRKQITTGRTGIDVRLELFSMVQRY